MPFAAALALVADLLPGAPVERSIRAGEVQSFTISTEAKRLVQVVIDQREVDLRATVLAPDGRVVAEYDQWEWGRESVTFLATAPGAYRLVVAPVGEVRFRTNFQVRLLPAAAPSQGGNHALAGEALCRDAKLLLASGNPQAVFTALAKRREALMFWQAASDQAAEAATRLGVGDLLYQTGEFDDAANAYRAGLLLTEALGDRRLEAGLRANLTAALWASGDVAEALGESARALDLTRNLKLVDGEATTLTNRGVLLWQTGDFDSALQHHRRARTIFRARGDRRSEAYALVNLALVLETLGQPRASVQYLAQAISLFRAVSDQRSEAQALVRRSRIQLAQRDTRMAHESARRALALLEGGADRLAEADARSSLGDVWTSTGDWSRARSEHERALSLYRELGNRRGESSALHGIGVSYLRSGDPARALVWLDQARMLRDSLGIPTLRAESLVQIASAARMEGDLRRAEAAAIEAIQLVDALRASVFERELRTSYAETIQRYYSDAVEILVEMHRRWPSEGYAARGFELVERARARDLVESAGAAQASAAKSDAPGVAQERRLREELNYWSWQLWQAAARPSSAETDRLKAKVEGLSEAHAAAEGDLRRSNPALRVSAREDVLSLQDIQRELLDPSTVLLEFALGEAGSVLWIVTADAVSLAELPPRRELQRLAERFVRAVASDPTTPDEVGGLATTAGRDARRLAEALGHLLLSPARAELSRHKRVLIAADGALHYVPFSALQLPGAGGPLVVSHDLAMVPSATVVTLVHRRVSTLPRSAKLLAVVADPVFDGRDARVSPPVPEVVKYGDAPSARRVGRLPFSGEEARRILALVPRAQRGEWLDFAATRETVTSSALETYRYVHFATHALRDDREPAMSGIVLSLVDRNGRARDGFVRLHDVYNMRLNSDLVVLSACETAVGRQAQGEGLLSLARGFYAAGAARVLATLWKVDDEATAAMMERFYKALLAGSSPAGALRQAQGAIRRERRWAHPYYWSGFVLQGEL